MPPRRIPTALNPVIEKEIESMLEKGVIEPATPVHGQAPYV